MGFLNNNLQVCIRGLPIARLYVDLGGGGGGEGGFARQLVARRGRTIGAISRDYLIGVARIVNRVRRLFSDDEIEEAYRETEATHVYRSVY